jgi:hypothetical protein
MTRMFQLNLILAALLIVVYGFSSVFSILHTSHMSHMHMATSPMADCPYMPGEQGLCTMNLFDHASAWQQFSSAFFPTLTLVLLSVVVFLTIRFYPPPLRYAYTHRRGPPVRLYQELFSQGILHTKLF